VEANAGTCFREYLFGTHARPRLTNFLSQDSQHADLSRLDSFENFFRKQTTGIRPDGSKNISLEHFAKA
jgi:hypothetical protein